MSMHRWSCEISNWNFKHVVEASDHLVALEPSEKKAMRFQNWNFKQTAKWIKKPEEWSAETGRCDLPGLLPSVAGGWPMHFKIFWRISVKRWSELKKNGSRARKAVGEIKYSEKSERATCGKFGWSFITNNRLSK